MISDRIEKHINSLLLDPNNYRFIDKSEYKFVPDSQITDEHIQQRTLNLLVGKNNENIKDLIISFKSNGFLDIDQIQTRSAGDKLLVLEGNRRVATLKFLYEEYKRGNDVGKLNENSFTSVKVVEIKDEDPVQHLITMGLHHISGKQRWSPVNEAQLISDLLYKYKKTENDICDSLGTTKLKLRRSVRTLSLIEQYKNSDYGDQFKTDMYSIFESVIGSSAMKTWLKWDDDKYKATNQNNLERFFSWISKTEEIERNEAGEERLTNKEPIISQYRDIRQLTHIINNEKALERMEKSRNITEEYALSDEFGKEKFRSAIDNMQSDIKRVINFNEYMTDHDYKEIVVLKNKLDIIVASNAGIIDTNEKSGTNYFAILDKHFVSLDIINYRKLQNIHIKNLARINIFAGNNNLGKTSFLESFYLLSQLNDSNALFDLERYRGKFYNEFQSSWLHKNLVNKIEINGNFNDSASELYIQKDEEGSEDLDKFGFLSAIKIDAKINNTNLDTNIYLYSDKNPIIKCAKTQILCKGALTSPYRYNIDLLSRAHNYAVKEKYFNDIIEFIRENLDTSIEKIEMVENNRFMVTSSKLNAAIDITKYGEGLQRVFEIALLMVYNRDGILCIDEIDCAIHKTLLVKFSMFVQLLADKYNVQVFLSTHSKECIDAFIKSNYKGNKDITAYSLSEKEGQIVCKYVSGERLYSLIESIDFDIR
jgi:AAA15 family ATPase/GTPase